MIGSQNESRIKRDKKGSLLPNEFECSFRARLEKRTPIDRFDRADTFFIDVNGRTAAACIEEARSLLTDVAPLWFDPLSHISQILASFENGSFPSPPDHVKPVYFGNRGSVACHETLSTLRLAQHSSDPTHQHQEALREEAGKLFGAYLGIPLTLSSALLDELQVHRIRGLLNEAQPVLDSPRFQTEVDLKVAVKQQIWPLLKEHGFSEFTTRWHAAL